MSDAAKGQPFPVRFDQEEDAGLREIKAGTGFTYSEIIRRACRFALPKFKSGEVDISRIIPTKQPSGEDQSE